MCGSAIKFLVPLEVLDIYGNGLSMTISEDTHYRTYI